MEIIRILLSLLGVLSLLTMVTAWILSIYHAATLKGENMQGEKVLWIVLIVFTGLLGSVIFFFVKGKEREGIVTVLSVLALPIIITLYAVLSFVVSSTLEANADRAEFGEMEVRMLEEVN